MDNDEDDSRSLWTAIRARSGVIVGIIGLIAWVGMIWAMFGDVL